MVFLPNWRQQGSEEKRDHMREEDMEATLVLF
jgi:hypothetical protein